MSNEIDSIVNSIEFTDVNTIQDTSPFVIVDASYVYHHCAHSVLKKYKDDGMLDISITKDNIHLVDWMQNAEFVKTFRDSFYKKIFFFINQRRVSHHRVIFALDCNKKNIWRRSIFQNYKLKRMESKTAKPNFGPLFNHMSEMVIPRLSERGMIVIRVDGAEGDDVIAVTKKRIRKDFPDNDIHILARDSDLLQLLDKNTYITDVSYTGSTFNLENTNPQKEVFMKVIAGDTSDGIPNIHKLCGPKTAEKYYENKELLMEKLKDKAIMNQFEINKKLIMFNYIPEELVQKIEQKLVEGGVR